MVWQYHLSPLRGTPTGDHGPINKVAVNVLGLHLGSQIGQGQDLIQAEVGLKGVT